MKKVAGKNRKHSVKVFTISTCGWCKKMKALLGALDVEYEYVDVDLLSGPELERANAELRKYNPRMSSPTLVVDDGKEVVIGFDEQKVRRCFRDGG